MSSIRSREQETPRQQDTSIACPAEESNGRRVEDAHTTDLLERMSDAYIRLDTHWRCLSVNGQAEALLGKTRAELHGRNMWEVLPMLVDSLFYLRAREAVDKKVDLAYSEFHPLLKRWLAVRLYPSQDGVEAFLQDITAQKQAEARQRAHEERFRVLIEHSSDAISLLDREGNRIYSTPSTTRILGYSTTDYIGYNVLDKIHPDDAPHVREVLAAIAQTPGISLPAQYRVQHQNGSWIWIEGTGTNLLDEPGVQAIVVNYRDISERKLAEEQLRLSEQRFRALIENSADAIALVDTQGTVLYVSPSTTSMLGFAPDEILGRNFLEFIHPADLESMQAVLGHILSEPGRSLVAHYRLRHKDGSWRWIEGSGMNLLDDPSVAAIVGNFRDITGRKRLEEELRKAKEQLETIFQNVADGITVQDAGGKVIYANKVGARAAGFLSVEAMLDAAHEDMRQIVSQFDIKDEWGMPIAIDQLPGRKALRGEKYAQAIVQYRSKANGRTFWSLLKAQPIFDEEGQVQFAVNVYTDITESKELELRKDEFIGVASHELKTPLTSIKGFTQLLHKRFLKREDEEALQMLARMNGQLNKLTDLINDLLDLSKMQSGKLPFREEAFDLGTLVSETVDDLQASANNHHIHIETFADALVYGDKDRIGQVLINLLTNAIKYSPAADTVIVRVASDQEQALVSVQDFGIGIAESHQSKIFERFYQVIETPQRTFPGLGIGLYISGEIIQRHHGRIWVESKPDEGSTFMFTLPLLF